MKTFERVEDGGRSTVRGGEGLKSFVTKVKEGSPSQLEARDVKNL